jgi:antitoxin component of MazEF toxin-antitoxin module
MGNSLHVTLPADVVREFDLDTGYAALMSFIPHGIKLKFMNAEELTTLMNGDAATEPAPRAEQHEEHAA